MGPKNQNLESTKGYLYLGKKKMGLDAGPICGGFTTTQVGRGRHAECVSARMRGLFGSHQFKGRWDFPKRRAEIKKLRLEKLTRNGGRHSVNSSRARKKDISLLVKKGGQGGTSERNCGYVLHTDSKKRENVFWGGTGGGGEVDGSARHSKMVVLETAAGLKARHKCR